MRQPLKNGRTQQSSQKEQVDKPSTSFRPRRSSRAVTSEDPDFRNTGFGSSKFARDLRIQSTEPPPRLEINGILYQRVDRKPPNKSPGHLSEAPSETPRPIARKRKRGSKTLRKNDSCESPEPQSEALSESPQPATRKRKCNSNMLREIQSHNKSPERRPEAASTQHITRKQKRNLEMLCEIQPHNKSPEPLLDITSDTPRFNTREFSQPALLKGKRKSNMLRELEAFNESPEGDSEPDVEMLDDSKGHLTRSARHDLLNLSKNRPLSPRKNLNLDKLMLAEFSGMPKGTKTFYAEDASNLGPSSSRRRQQESENRVEIKIEEEDEEEYLAGDINTSGRKHSQPKSTRGTTARQLGESAGKGKRNQEVTPESLWSVWDSEKGKINELLKTPRYSPPQSQLEMVAQGRRRPAYHVRAETPEDFQGAFHVEQGLHVFTPTAIAFSDFTRFLRGVEEVAGREVGVVKVVIPSRYLSCIPTPAGGTVPRSSVMKTTKVKLSLNEEAPEEASKIYDMFKADDSTALEPDDLLRIIQRDKNNIIKTCKISTEAISQDKVWQENHVLRPYTEGKMIRRSENPDKATLTALNEPATPHLRAALRCRDPKIEHFFGNRFASSRSTEPGINESVFHISGGAGPLSALQTNKYAAYSINYHHSGAPRIVTVTRPEHHDKIEEFMYITQDSGNLFGRPPKPPACSQFVAHQPMYVPQGTLSFYGVDHTEVVQNQGEMVIIFPYAYHQVYTSGPNITEEILYASDRCRVFHREGLYQHCNPDCAAEQPDEFDVDLVFSDSLGSARTAGRYRSSREVALQSS